MIDQARKRFHLPAIAVTVMNSQTILFQEVQGVRNIEQPDSATLDDYFHIGSCSKSVLAMIAAKLVEQKKITWQTGFFDVYPEFEAQSNPAYDLITLEDLFVGEAGIKAYTNAAEEPFPEFAASSGDQRLKFVEFLLMQPPASEKRNGKFQHLYSNAGYTLASVMLERVSGQGYKELVRSMLTADMGISVHFGWPNALGVKQPWGHRIIHDKVEAFPPDHEYHISCLITPAGDLSMTAKGYAKYTQLHLQGLRGADNVIPSAAYQYIHYSRRGMSIGVANGMLARRRFSVFDGSAGTFFCRSILVPESDFAFTLMFNAGSGSGSMKAVDWLSMHIVKKHFNWWWRFWL